MNKKAEWRTSEMPEQSRHNRETPFLILDFCQETFILLKFDHNRNFETGIQQSTVTKKSYSSTPIVMCIHFALLSSKDVIKMFSSLFESVYCLWKH